jgi:hypothetical protein
MLSSVPFLLAIRAISPFCLAAFIGFYKSISCVSAISGVCCSSTSWLVGDARPAWRRKCLAPAVTGGIPKSPNFLMRLSSMLTERATLLLRGYTSSLHGSSLNLEYLGMLGFASYQLIKYSTYRDRWRIVPHASQYLAVFYAFVVSRQGSY